MRPQPQIRKAFNNRLHRSNVFNRMPLMAYKKSDACFGE
jgi:hypothetical protein